MNTISAMVPRALIPIILGIVSLSVALLCFLSTANASDKLKDTYAENQFQLIEGKWLLKEVRCDNKSSNNMLR